MSKTTITRSLTTINKEVAELNRSIKILNKENKEMNKSLQFDPTNMILVNQKAGNLKDLIQLNTNKVKALNDALIKLDGQGLSKEELLKRQKKITREIGLATSEINGFKKQLKEANSIELDKLSGQLQSVSKVATKVVAGIIAIGTTFAITGSKIQKASNKYRMSVEDFQRGSYVLQRTTGDANAYTLALENVTIVMAQLARGAGKAKQNFARFGMTFDDFVGKSPSESIDFIISKLQHLEDADERAQMATILLGQHGVVLAQAAGLTAAELQNLNEMLEEEGILSNEQTEAAERLKDSFDLLKRKFTEVMAELSTSLIPMFDALMVVAHNVIKVISFLSSTFNLFGDDTKKAIVMVLLVLVVLPKVITVIKALTTTITVLKAAFVAVQSAMFGVNAAGYVLAANPVVLTIMAIVAAVAAAIALIVLLAKLLSKVFGKKYKLELETPKLGIGSPEYGSAIVNGTNQSGGEAYDLRGNPTGKEIQYTQYYDYSIMNNTIDSGMDIDDIAEQLSLKIKVGGAR